MSSSTAPLQPFTFPSTHGVFVIGTDTGVGKTAVACALARLAYMSGFAVGVFKPMATGCRWDQRLGLVSEDAEYLSAAADSVSPLHDVCPICYHEPLAPLVAAQRAGKPPDLTLLADAYARVVKESDFVVVEGVGGLLVPLGANLSVADLAVALRLPVLIVARPGLGTINHTLLTLEACQKRSLKVLGVAINGYQAGSATLAEETNPPIIADLTRLPVAVLPWMEKFNPANMAQLDELGAALAQVIKLPGISA